LETHIWILLSGEVNLVKLASSSPETLALADAQSSMNEQEREINEKSAEAFLREGESLDEKELKPEDAIPDLPENQAAREFLKNAPTNGLFMPLGKEVKVMQCWRCKAYGHR
jgi:Tfp pilus assembly protein PilX